MHNHETMTMTSGSINQMTLMWILMGLMATHHVIMWWKMRGKK
jgi:hypothetical protein